MNDDFQYFTGKFLEIQRNYDILQEKMKTEEKKIFSANIFLKEILNFDLFNAFFELIEFNKKLWSKVLYGSFEKVDFDLINNLFLENYQKIDKNKIQKYKIYISNLEIENDILKTELEKIIFSTGIKDKEKIRYIISANISKHRNIISNYNQNNLTKEKISNLNISNNSIKSSFRKKNNSKSHFIRNNNKDSKRPYTKISKCSQKNILDKENSIKSILNKDSFNKLIFNSYSTNNHIPKINNYSISTNNMNLNHKNENSNTIIDKNPYISHYYSSNTANYSEPKSMLNSIFDKYKSENTNNSYFPYSYIYDPKSNSYVKKETRPYNTYQANNTETIMEKYIYNSNNIIGNKPDNYNAINNNIYSNNSNNLNNTLNYNQINSSPLIKENQNIFNLSNLNNKYSINNETLNRDIEFNKNTNINNNQNQVYVNQDKNFYYNNSSFNSINNTNNLYNPNNHNNINHIASNYFSGGPDNINEMNLNEKNCLNHNISADINAYNNKNEDLNKNNFPKIETLGQLDKNFTDKSNIEPNCSKIIHDDNNIKSSINCENDKNKESIFSVCNNDNNIILDKNASIKSNTDNQEINLKNSKSIPKLIIYSKEDNNILDDYRSKNIF